MTVMDMEQTLNNSKSDEDKMAAEAICPTCGKPVPTHKCRFCGATKSINSATGNVVWMKNGRVVEAFQDAKQAYIKTAIRHHIPESEWPEKFRGGK
jgi:predicted amidophosphoribosyltransferase